MSTLFVINTNNKRKNVGTLPLILFDYVVTRQQRFVNTTCRKMLLGIMLRNQLQRFQNRKIAEMNRDISIQGTCCGQKPLTKDCSMNTHSHQRHMLFHCGFFRRQLTQLTVTYRTVVCPLPLTAAERKTIVK